MAAPSFSKLDANQCIQGSFDDEKGRLRVETEATIVNGAVEVALDASSDSIAIGNSNNSNTLLINSDGSINVSDVTVSGNISEAPLNAFDTSQYTIGMSIVEITPTPLVGRKSISLRVVANANASIYVGPTAATTISTGWLMVNGDTLQMDLDDTHRIFAIADAEGQTIFALEIA